MISIPVFFGILAGVIALLEIYPYALSILGKDVFLRKIPDEKRTVPNLATWTIFSVQGLIVTYSYLERNDFSNLWFYAGLTLEYLIAATLALWYGEHRRNGTAPFSRFDLICLTGAGLGLIGWYFSGSWEVPLAINMIIDGFGIAPTVRKVWRRPLTESLLAWSMTLTASACAIVALGPLNTWSFNHSAFTVYMVCTSGLVWLLLLRRFARSGQPPG